MNIRASAEDYLESILMIGKRKGSVRSIDIANELGFSKPSVSVAMKHLRENHYIRMDEGGFITLTDAGYAVADKVYERHCVVTEYFELLGVPSETAEKDACKIEHILSNDSFQAIKNQCEKLKREKEQ